MDIVATYCTNYNGFYLQGEGIDDEDDKADEVRTNVVDELVDKCDDDGEYYGSEKKAIEIIIREVKAVYGNDVNVTVKFDNVST